MSQYISDENGAQDMVSSNRGWGQFGDWVEGLSASRFPKVVHLWKYGWVGAPPELARQLIAAAAAEKPEPDVVSINDTIQTFCQSNQNSEIVIISNGVTNDDTAEIVARGLK